MGVYGGHGRATESMLVHAAHCSLCRTLYTEQAEFLLNQLRGLDPKRKST